MNEIIYRIEDVYGHIINMDEFIKVKFSELNLTFNNIVSSITRRPYDPTDFTCWILSYSNIYDMKNDKEKLLNIVDSIDKPIFNVSGNGYGTGLCVMLPLSKNFDK